MFVYMFTLFALIAAVRWQIVTGKALPSILAYTGATLALGLLAVMGGQLTLPWLIVLTALRLVLSAIYFWLLERFSDRLYWWLVLPLGAVLAMV